MTSLTNKQLIAGCCSAIIVLAAIAIMRLITTNMIVVYSASILIGCIAYLGYHFKELKNKLKKTNVEPSAEEKVKKLARVSDKLVTISLIINSIFFSFIFVQVSQFINFDFLSTTAKVIIEIFYFTSFMFVITFFIYTKKEIKEYSILSYLSFNFTKLDFTSEESHIKSKVAEKNLSKENAKIKVQKRISLLYQEALIAIEEFGILKVKMYSLLSGTKMICKMIIALVISLFVIPTSPFIIVLGGYDVCKDGCKVIIEKLLEIELLTGILSASLVIFLMWGRIIETNHSFQLIAVTIFSVSMSFLITVVFCRIGNKRIKFTKKKWQWTTITPFLELCIKSINSIFWKRLGMMPQ